jgi:hypothetical protein
MPPRPYGVPAFAAIVAAILLALSWSPTSTYAAVFKVVAADRMGDGFNDLTPRAPVGGNSGTTLGAQRLNVMRHAANLWGAVLHSNVIIRWEVEFGPFEPGDCLPASAWLGYAGPTAAFANFAGAPRADTLYPSALADSLAGTDLYPAGVDISAAFNQDIDTGCFSVGAPNGWYYGYDNNPPPGAINLLQTVLHELAHGLGFASFIGPNGARCCGTRPMDDAFMVNLEWHEIGLTWPFLADHERVLSAISGDGLHWVGPNVQAAVAYLTAGRSGSHVHMHAPAAYQSGASVSHFSTDLTPNELLEPYLASSALRVLSIAALQDIGWVLQGAPTPTEVSTWTPTLTSTPTRPAPTVTAPPTASATPTITAVAATPTASLGPTPREQACSCDCDEDGLVSIREVQGIAAIYLDMQSLLHCPGADRGGDGSVSIQELQRAANEYLRGCP